jgi:hypothetical protein
VDESEWLAAGDVDAMLTFLRESGKATERRFRLLAAACCRRVWHLLGDARCRGAVETAELYADGLAGLGTLEAAEAGVVAVLEALDPWPHRSLPRELYPVYHAAEAAGGVASAHPYEEGGDAFRAVASIAAYALGTRDGVERPDPAERRVQVELIRDIFGPLPFRPIPPLPPSVRTWSDGLARQLAQSAYDERLLPSGHLEPARLAVLADALLDAGCDEAWLIDHLREEGPHVRGCAAVDAVLGRD